MMAKIFYFLGHEQFQPEVLVKHAVLAEEAGFDGVFVSEHFNPWVADVGAAGFALATLGAIAVQTKKIQLMTGVLTPLFRYHPAVVAQAAATIDRLSGGRFSLGVGNGEALNEVPLGYTYPAYSERAARMKEALEIMQKLLHGEKVTYQGKFYQVNNVKLASPPVKPVQISLAAGGQKSALLATEYADGLIVSVKNPEESLTNLITPAKQKAEELKKPLEIIATRWTIFANTPDEAWQAIQPWRGLRAPHRDTITDPQALQQEADALTHEEVLERYLLVKSAEDYIAAYKPLLETLHADTVVIQTTGVNNQEKLIDMIGKNVLPSLRNLNTHATQSQSG